MYEKASKVGVVLSNEDNQMLYVLSKRLYVENQHEVALNADFIE